MPSVFIQKLLITPLPTSEKPLNKVAKEARKAATQSLWKALNQGDLEQVKHAYQQGASLTGRRGGRTALYEAVLQGHWEVAEALRGWGADIHAQTQSHESLGHAIASRDKVEEAERLVQWGCNPETWTYGEISQSPHLLNWWIQRGNASKLPDPHSPVHLERNEVRALLFRSALSGYEPLLDQLSLAWGETMVAGRAVFSPQFHTEYLAHVWGDLYRKDAASAIALCVKKGWAPKFESEMEVAYEMWRMNNFGAVETLNWFRAVPECNAAMLKHAGHLMSLWAEKSTQSVPDLKRVLVMGVPFTVQDDRGNNLAHYAIGKHTLSQGMLDFLFEHAKEALVQNNDDDETPLCYLGPQEQARYEAKLIAHGTVGTPQGKKSVLRL